MKKVLLGAVVVAAGIVLFGGCMAYGGYKKAVALDENVKASWGQVENVLKRRFDLIPNLVETVKGYAQHEQKIFTDIAEARTRYFSAGSQAEKVEAANGFERALSRLLVLQEQYPQLKAQEGFLKLQDELSGTENRIAVERKRYNDTVKELNTYVRGPLGRIWAGMAGVSKAEYFEIAPAEKEVPKVDFSPAA